MWEVPMHVPDILASAQALSAYASAYRITGDAKYLEKARYWAWTGVPFIYFWGAPDLPVMKGGSCPVMGSSWYARGLWIGRPVQWCGLVYADSLFDFAPLDPSFPWKTLAEAIAISGVNQQSDKAPDKGRYPDSWVLRTNERSEKAMLDPMHLSADLAAALGAPVRPGTVVLRQGGERLHLTSWNAIEKAEWKGGALRFDARLERDNPGLFLLARANEPAEVRVDGAPLSKADDLDAVERGWAYDAKGRYLFLKTGKAAKEVEVNWTGR
ncbi:MAG: hypothetical protein NTW86_09495, partial [Candidatus Sumerlaeota bacterium]|nr:hypothetical protein [Candidatus Sumerlaeota bacterium]